MPKKIQKLDPKPKQNLTPERAEEYVSTGVGHDTALEQAKETASDEPVSRLTIVVPKQLHKQFKLVCVDEDRPMNEAIRDLMQKHIDARAIGA